MADVTSGIRMLHMIQAFSRLVTDILIHGSLTGSIKNLHSTADRKDWFAGREHLFHKTDLKQVQGNNGAADSGAGFLSEEKRCDIIAAAEQKAITEF